MDKPRVVTSSWFTDLPPDFCRIGVSRGVPRNQSGYRMYRKLQPGPYLKLPDGPFTERYHTEVLDRLDPRQTVDEFMALAAGKSVAILCFEHPHSATWCHRAMISAWLQQTLGLDVPEYGREREGCGIAHPKLCPEARAYHTRPNAGRTTG